MNDLTQTQENSIIQSEQIQNLYLYFQLGLNHYALNVENVLEVMKLPILDYPQKLPDNIIGLLNYNDMTINVLDIRMYLNLEITSYNTNNKLIIVNFKDVIMGLIVDDINDIISINDFELESCNYNLENNFIKTMFYVENQAVSIVDLNVLNKLLETRVKIKNVDVEKLFPKDDFSKEILEKRSKNLITRSKIYLPQQNLYSQNKFISFMLNKNKYCIKLSYIKEVSQKAGIINIPCAPDYIEGLTTLRGDFITIINLKKFLNLSQTDCSKQSKIIIIEAENYKLGFLTDKIFEITDISEDLIQNSKTNETSYILSEPIIDNDLYQILNMEKILTDEKFYIDEE